MNTLQGKRVVITGASSGIGKACALAFANEKCNLVLAARNKEKLDEIVALCRAKGIAVTGVKTDVSIENDCKNLIDTAIIEFGGVDILINNAGLSMRAVFAETDLSVLKKLMDVNFWGMVYCVHYTLPSLLKNGGSVVGVSSIAAFKGLPARSGYSSSKFAMNGFLETLRIENLYTGLHVMTCAPGFTSSNIRNTALTKDGTVQSESPLDENKLMSAEQVAAEIVDGVKKRKRVIILSTVGKLTVLLNKFFPYIMDKLVYRRMAKEKNSPLKQSKSYEGREI